MLRIRLYSGSDSDDICDYCRKQDGTEIISLFLTRRTVEERAWIQIHTKCLMQQLKKLHNLPRIKETV